MTFEEDYYAKWRGTNWSYPLSLIYGSWVLLFLCIERDKEISGSTDFIEGGRKVYWNGWWWVCV